MNSGSRLDGSRGDGDFCILQFAICTRHQWRHLWIYIFCRTQHFCINIIFLWQISRSFINFHILKEYLLIYLSILGLLNVRLCFSKSLSYQNLSISIWASSYNPKYIQVLIGCIAPVNIEDIYWILKLGWRWLWIYPTCLSSTLTRFLKAKIISYYVFLCLLIHLYA